jgi:putative ABC transport system permease protein
VRQSAVFGAQLNLVFLGAFSFFAILATVLVIGSTVSSSVLSQFREIGMLKAIGFGPNQILSLYVGQYLVLAAIGAPLGLLLGIALSPLPLQSVAASLSTVFRPPMNVLLVALVLGIVPCVVVAACLGAAYRGARANIIKAIAVGAEAPRKKSAGGVQLAARMGLPMILALGLNDVFARPLRSLMTGLNLTLGVIGIVFGLALNQTLDTYRQDPSLLGIPYDAIVTREVTSDSKTRHMLSRAPGVHAFYVESMLDVETPGDDSFQVRAVEGDLEVFPFRISTGRLFQPNAYEAIAGRGLLDWLGLQVGDEVTTILDGSENRPVTWRIVGQYAEPVNAGQMLMVPLSVAQRTARSAEPHRYLLKLDPYADTGRLKGYLEPRADADLNLVLVGQAIPSAVAYLQLAILGLAGILIGIATINVFNTSLVAMRERVRQIGVLKTVGMTPTQVLVMANTTAAALGLLAAGVGIPLGLAFTRGMLAILSSSYGFGRVNVALGVTHAVLLVPAMAVVSIAGSFVPGLQAARTSIVQVLRHE